MAFAYQSKTWNITGEKDFENSFTLLNPTIAVGQVVINGNDVYLQLNIKENGGIYIHSFNVKYANVGGETNIDLIVDGAISAAFPDATLNQ